MDKMASIYCDRETELSDRYTWISKTELKISDKLTSISSNDKQFNVLNFLNYIFIDFREEQGGRER